MATIEYGDFCCVAIHTCGGMTGWAVVDPEHPRRFANWAIRMLGESYTAKVFFDDEVTLKTRAICHCFPPVHGAAS